MKAPRKPSKPEAVTQDAWGQLSAQGYCHLSLRNGQLCAIKPFAYTTALLVGLDAVGYTLRYCYEHASEAEAALAVWDGTGHPSGPWIKCKGAGVELLNPELRC